MEAFEYTITDPNGLHARPAGLLVRKAQEFDCEITLSCHGKSASLKKLLAVMGLGVRCGDTVSLSADGTDAPACVNALRAFFEENF